MVSAENMRNCENTNRGCAAVFVGCVQLCYEAVHGLHNKINYYQTGKKLKLLDFDAVECETSIFLVCAFFILHIKDCLAHLVLWHFYM